nr:UvrD-helicase domain-containing protein [Nocardioides soli]
MRADAEGFIAALPASVTMPAGAGKTHLLAATARVLADAGAKVLVLTHTHAGLHAIRGRLKRFGVSTAQCQVSTITSFAITLARPYPTLGGVRVPATPDMDDATLYVAAATAVATSEHIRKVLAASYTHVLVDEYQDCSEGQHAFVLAIKAAISQVGVLGDPFQAIFGFKEQLPDWEREVLTEFPDHPIDPQPRRWDDHNQALGAWLHGTVRKAMHPRSLKFAGVKFPDGVTFRNTVGDYPAIFSEARRDRPKSESVLIITARASSARTLAGRLGGSFKMMEEVAGNFMVKALEALVAAEPDAYALWLFDLMKACACGHAGLDKNTVRKRYVENRSSAGLTRVGFEPALAAFDRLVAEPTLANLVLGMDQLLTSRGMALHSSEAWLDIQAAIRGAVAAGDDKSVLLDELAKARENVRHTGRRNRNRVISRTLLVKGLEFDHVVIADIADHTEVHDLYVALTRARKTITILGTKDEIELKPSPNGPKK